MRAIIPGLCLCLGLSFTACRKNTTTPVIDTTLDFSAVDKVLADSVPVRFGGKCYVIIDVNGKPVYAKSFGGYNGSTRQLIASCSKWLSGAVVMRMVDEGKFKLSDTLGKYLPIFTSYGKGNITMAQLFSHTSGFPGNSDQGYESNTLLTLEAAVDLIAKNVPLINPPGSRFYYGGVGMQVAGRVCEVVSGKKWSDLFAEKLADPLGMRNTDFGLTANPIIAGGARSTPDDYMLFLNMVLNKGVAANGTRVLSEAAVTALEQSQIGNATVAYSPYPLMWINTTHIYGIGNWRDLAGANDLLVESSSPGAFGSHPWINYDKKISGFIFTFVASDGELSPVVPTCIKVRSLVRDIVE